MSQIQTTRFTSRRILTLKRRYNIRTSSDMIIHLINFYDQTTEEFPDIPLLYRIYKPKGNNHTHITIDSKVVDALKQFQENHHKYKLTSYDKLLSALMDWHFTIRDGMRSEKGFYSYPKYIY